MDTNTKYIIGGAIALFIIALVSYFVFKPKGPRPSGSGGSGGSGGSSPSGSGGSSPSGSGGSGSGGSGSGGSGSGGSGSGGSGSGGSGSGGNTPKPVDPSGCLTDKPTEGPTGCTYICDKNYGNGIWRCKTECDDNEKSQECGDPTQMKCDKNLKAFYCESNVKCNFHGNYYNDLTNHCQCHTGYTGSDCNSVFIPNCKEYNTDSTCKVCNDPYYGQHCENKCKDNEMYNGKSCVCVTGYINVTGTCKLKGDCLTGYKLNDKCQCDENTYGDMCQYTLKCPDESEKVKSDDGKGYCDCSQTKTCTTKDPCDTKKNCNKGKLHYKGDNTYNCGDSRCVCEQGYEGDNCQCDLSKKDNTKLNKCLGEKFVCQPDGTYKIERMSCSDLYTSYGNQDNWISQCSNDPGVMRSSCATGYLHFITCSDDPNNSASITCKNGCPTDIPSDPCDKCDSQGLACNCDNNTEYKYMCSTKQNPSDCGAVSSNFCQQGHSVTCVICDPEKKNNYSENICDNNPPSQQCLINMIRGLNTKNGVEYNGDTTIYPTIDNDACLKGEKPTDYLQSGAYNWVGWSRFNNNTGYIMDKKFVSDPTKLASHTFKSTKDNKITCYWPDKDIAAHLGDPGKQLCNSRGTFEQVQDKMEGNCTCNPGYAGSNCQYSDAETCKGNGTANKDGTCTCHPGVFGTNCQFTNANCSPGVITGLDGSGNPICDYSNVCSTKFPRCKTCSNTNNYNNMTCSQTVNDTIFDKDNCTTHTNGATEWGCPLKKDSIYWSSKIGNACHHFNDDYKGCINGSVISQVSMDGQYKYDFCQLDDFTKISEFSSINKDGLNTNVSSPSLTNADQHIVYVMPPSGNIPVNSDLSAQNYTGICRTAYNDTSHIRLANAASPLQFGQKGNPTNWT
jgi:hypothetical protein